MKKSNKAIVVNKINECPKCNNLMERRKHPAHYIHKKPYYYTEWDFCPFCKHVQHYEEYKSEAWKFFEEKDEFLKLL